jgi:hypothetical protein
MKNALLNNRKIINRFAPSSIIAAKKTNLKCSENVSEVDFCAQ